MMNREIHDMERRCVDRHNSLGRHMNKIQQQQSQMVINQDINAAKEVVAHAYGKANSYSNIIIAAGYAGFFTLWSSLKNDLPTQAILISGALILISMMIFIGFELYKMINISNKMNKISKHLEKPNQSTLTKIKEIEKKTRYSMLECGFGH